MGMVGLYDRQGMLRFVGSSIDACLDYAALFEIPLIPSSLQSLPEPGMAIVAMGKRDIGFDLAPEALRRYREGGPTDQTLSVDGWKVIKQMAQHTFIELPADATDVRIGDVLAFGASHPCMTFDKWRQLHLVDDQLEVVETWETRF